MQPFPHVDPELVNTGAFLGTNPTGELITSGLPVTREGRPGMSPNLQKFAQDCSEEELRAVCKELFIPQRDQRIDTYRPPRRYVTRKQSNTEE
jgi:hypothetical protein